jgi:hypothetical protein
MLHAIQKKKTSYYTRYTGHRDGSEKRVSCEDEITSSVFGPLDFMATEAVFQFVKAIFRAIGQQSKFPAGAPVSHELLFWPRRKHVESDAHLLLKWPNDENVNILLEVKWRAALSGEHQLHLQWNNYFERKERETGWHIFLAHEISEGITARQSPDGERWQVNCEDRLLLLSWLQFRLALSELNKRQDAIARWAGVTDGFLDRVGIRHFCGFSNIAVELPEFDTWSPHFFNRGAFRLKALSEQVTCTFQPFFKG